MLWETYQRLWGGPVAGLLVELVPAAPQLTAGVVFVWATMFLAANLALVLVHGETAWGRYDGDNHPMGAAIMVALAFVTLPLAVLAAFVTSRWDAQDLGIEVLGCWLAFLTAFFWLGSALL